MPTLQQKVDVIRHWRQDLADYARHNLKIRGKTPHLLPLELNAAQQALMEAADAQRDETGMVRIVVVKGRQLGISTVIAARLVRDVMLRNGVQAMVIAHKQEATKNLAQMTRRFYDHLPAGRRQRVTKRNDMELVFANDTRYLLTTAGSRETGRSSTLQRLHASEYAFWDMAGEHAAGLGQALADEPGTEAYVESTAKGQANALYGLWQQACSGIDTPYRPVFLPWFIEPAYSASPPRGFDLSRDAPREGALSEYEYREAYDLTLSQMYWRRVKLTSFSALPGIDAWQKWCSEYPATAEEAFFSTSLDSFLDAGRIALAAHHYIDHVETRAAPMTLGVDPAPSHGPSSTAFIRVRGLKAYGLRLEPTYTHSDTITAVMRIWAEERPWAVCVDVGEGVGDTVVNELGARGVNVIPVNFGGAAQDPTRYKNRRAEMYSRLSAWLGRQVDLPNHDVLIRDLLAQRRQPGDGKLIQLIGKDKIMKDGQLSPDASDALALCFAVQPPLLHAMEPIAVGQPDVFRDNALWRESRQR